MTEMFAIGCAAVVVSFFLSLLISTTTLLLARQALDSFVHGVVTCHRVQLCKKETVRSAVSFSASFSDVSLVLGSLP